MGTLTIMKGKIVLKENKVKFEYHELEKPDKTSFYVPVYGHREKAFEMAMKKHETLKRIIKVSNAYKVKLNTFGYKVHRLLDKSDNIINVTLKDKQSCEAEVENNVATIIKIN